MFVGKLQKADERKKYKIKQKLLLSFHFISIYFVRVDIIYNINNISFNISGQSIYKHSIKLQRKRKDIY